VAAPESGLQRHGGAEGSDAVSMQSTSFYKKFNSLVVNCYVGGPHPGSSFKVSRDQPCFVEGWKITLSHRGCDSLLYWRIELSAGIWKLKKFVSTKEA